MCECTGCDAECGTGCEAGSGKDLSIRRILTIGGGLVPADAQGLAVQVFSRVEDMFPAIIIDGEGDVRAMHVSVSFDPVSDEDLVGLPPDVLNDYFRHLVDELIGRGDIEEYEHDGTKMYRLTEQGHEKACELPE